MDFFICLVHQQLLCTSSGMVSSSLVWSINSCFVHHLAWIPSALTHQQLFVHDLESVVLHWSHPSTVVSCIIWYGFLYLSCPSTVVLYMIWYGKSILGLIHQQLFCTSHGMDSAISSINSCLCMIWYGQSFIGLIHQQLFRASSGMDFFISLVHQQLFCASSGMVRPSLVRSISSCFVQYLAWIPSALIHHQLFYTPSGLGSPSLVSAINSCFVHHLVWISLTVSSINSCFVHRLAW